MSVGGGGGRGKIVLLCWFYATPDDRRVLEYKI
jgi:hypothetical protein